MKKVFYDGNCPICKREIGVYKKLNQNKHIEWYNIYDDDKALKIIKKSREDCLRIFHVIDKAKVYTGIEAFLFYGKILNILKYYIMYSIFL